MNEAEPAAARRLTTEALLDAAMDRARGLAGGPRAEAHARLVQAARSFALVADPRGRSAWRRGGCDVRAAREGLRVVVTIVRDGARVTVSGQRGESGLWGLDAIDATEGEALAMLADAARDWPPGG